MPERVVIQRVPTSEKVCPICGQTFEGVSKQRYCGRNCQQKASYARHAEARRVARRERYAREKGTEDAAGTER